MDFYTILSEIMSEKGLSVADVARICDLTDSTVRSIIDRKQKKVALNVAFKLSDGLGVSLERLNGMPDTKISPAMMAGDEEKLLNYYRGMNADGKARLMEQAELLVVKYRKDSGSAAG